MPLQHCRCRCVLLLFLALLLSPVLSSAQEFTRVGPSLGSAIYSDLTSEHTLADARPASLTTALAGSNNDLTFTAVAKGPEGADVSVTYVVSGNNTPLSVAVSGSAITVTVATNGGGAATSTASQVLAAVQSSAAASALVTVALAAGNSGAGVVTTLAPAHLGGIAIGYALPPRARTITVCVDAAVRYLFGATPVTSSRGLLMTAGCATLSNNGDLIRQFRFIRDGSGSPTMTVEFYGQQ